ncbi:hypothetical protein F5Y16DRAFT_406843 [Xylariaceae sp. FL0255]|nr:hypothetical protein F5Y16DRAFT_406843 [Xylariaceae sp. FL0255]
MSDGDAESTEDFLVNGIAIPVTTKLASALRSFRQYGFPQTEMLCVSTKALMPWKKRTIASLSVEICKQASAVLSWLGLPGQFRMDKGLQIIQDYASASERFRALPDRDWLISSVFWLETLRERGAAEGYMNGLMLFQALLTNVY